MSDTAELHCPADGTALVPSYSQPIPNVVILRCTSCAFHLQVPKACGKQNCFTLVELESALTAARAAVNAHTGNNADVMRLQLHALARAVRRLDPGSQSLVGLEQPIEVIVRHLASC